MAFLFFFSEQTTTRYFVMTKKSSFLRQLNLYSFNRFSAGTTDKGSYYHEKFLRCKKFLSRRMTRQKVNGNRIRSAGKPEEEPDLSRYPICRDDNNTNSTKNHHHPSALSLSSSSPQSLVATPGAVGRVIVSTGSASLLPPSSQSSMIMHAAVAAAAPGPAQTAKDPSVAAGAIRNRNAAVGTASPVLRVL